MSKKQYFSPALRNLTSEQAKQMIADGKNCSDEEAAEFLASLQRPKHQTHERGNELPGDYDEQEKVAERSETHPRKMAC